MAISQKQIEANRRNASKSTGPKTDEGKEASRANATTHGLTASTATIYLPIRHENPQDFQDLRASLINDIQPANTREMLCIEMMAAAYKRIQRSEAMETAFLDGGMEAMQHRAGLPLEPAGDADRLGCAIVMGKKEFKLTWQNLDRYRRSAWLDYNRSQEQLRRLVRERLDNAVLQQQQELADEMASFRPAEDTAAFAAGAGQPVAAEVTAPETEASAPSYQQLPEPLPAEAQMGSFRTNTPEPYPNLAEAA